MEIPNQFLNEKQDPQVVQKVMVRTSELLTEGEKILYVAVQKKPALNLSPDSLVLTDRRIIIYRPKTLGLAMSFHDFLWKDVANSHVKEGVLGATFMIQITNKRRYSIDYLPKQQARKLYRFAQEKEEEMSEYRRSRELENARAAAGGIVLNANNEPNPSIQNNDPKTALEKLKSLYENELITENEYSSKKQEILDKL